MPEDNKAVRLQEYAAETLQNEVERFWKRSLFFWGFIAAAFVSYSYAIKNNSDDKDVLLAISCFGFICSVAWTLANRGSKYWQWAWEQKLKSTEEASFGRKIFDEDILNTNRDFWGGWRYSVTRLTIALSDFTVLIWLVLGYRVSPLPQDLASRCLPFIILAFTGVYLVAILFGGRSRKP